MTELNNGRTATLPEDIYAQPTKSKERLSYYIQGNSPDKGGQNTRMVSEHISCELLDNNNPFDSRKTKGDRETLISTKSGPQLLIESNDVAEEERQQSTIALNMRFKNKAIPESFQDHYFALSPQDKQKK